MMPGPALQSRLLPLASVLGPPAKICSPGLGFGRWGNSRETYHLRTQQTVPRKRPSPIWHPDRAGSETACSPVPIDTQLPRLTRLAPSPHHPSPITYPITLPYQRRIRLASRPRITAAPLLTPPIVRICRALAALCGVRVEQALRLCCLRTRAMPRLIHRRSK